MLRSSKYLFLIALVLFFAWFGAADEGMWMPHQIKESGLKAKGLKIPLVELYNENGTGLMNAVVHFRGGTGSFVSKKGLILTNYHVAYGALQRASDREHDYLAHGFLARTTAEEIPAYGYYIDVFLGYEEVSSTVLKHLKPHMTAEQRIKTLERIEKKLTAKAEKKGKDLYCTFKSMYSGNQYYLFRYKRLHDVRIVYAPPRSIGIYGGEIDNWMWPRHTGDFTFLRAYVSRDNVGVPYSPENVPYQPTSILKVSIDGVKPGGFTLVTGYPGSTYREYTLAEFQFEIQRMKQRIDTYKLIIRFLEQVTKNDRALRIKYASMLLGLNNGLKYRIATLAGSQKQSIVERKKDIEEKFIQWVEQDAREKKKYNTVLTKMEDFIRDNRDFYRKYRLFSDLTSIYRGPALLVQAYLVFRTAEEKQKPDIKREKDFQEKDLPNIKTRIQNAERSYDLETDKAYFKFLLNRMLTFDKSLVPGVFLPVLQGGEARIEKYVDQLYTTEILTDPKKRLELLRLKPSQLLGLNDPLINLAAALENELRLLREKEKVVNQQRQDLRKVYIAGLLEMYQGKIASDANGSIRFSYGPVKGYHPRDGVTYLSHTTLTGVMEKETGAYPFEVPAKLKKLHQARDFGKYIDKDLDNIPVCFLNIIDSTGGNSGSPVLDANGEIVGLLFDGVYESVIGDYFVVTEFQRVINVDIRYVLFVTEKFSGAHHVLKELGL
ncbi:MAG: S46 family peptidase [Candidatus Aminicenantes bacterium]|nr:MAG: S46 family peptidase [Candidatus Aminicenantes bacterium]